jgi:hypothetical protein
MRMNLHLRVKPVEFLFGRLHLFPADILGGVKDLALQVGKLYAVMVHQTQRADSRRRQIKSGRAAQASGADHQGPALAHPDLPFAAQVRDHNLAAIAFDLVWCEAKRHDFLVPLTLAPSPKGRGKG